VGARSRGGASGPVARRTRDAHGAADRRRGRNAAIESILVSGNSRRSVAQTTH
jgi:hypothetical protein